MSVILLPDTRAYSKLIGIPYSKLDCWGLCLRFYKNHGVDLPSYYRFRPENDNQSENLIEKAKPDYMSIKINDRAYGDLVLMNVAGYNCHVGVLVKGDKILHTLKHFDSVLSPFKKWQARVVGIYRPRI